MIESASPGVLNFKIFLGRDICRYATQENLTSYLLHLNYPPKLKVIATPAGKYFLKLLYEPFLQTTGYSSSI